MMSRYAGDRRPRVRPVQKVELNEKNLKRRGILAAFFACLGISALLFGFMQLFRSEAGWEKIEALSSSYDTCAGDFVFQYELGTGETSATAEKKALQKVYTQTAEYAYWLFQSDEEPEAPTALEGHNISYINAHPGEEIRVDEALYRAFAMLEEQGNRLIYLGPLYARYDDLFYCQDDSQAREYDPVHNPEVAEEYRTIAGFAGDESAVRVELLGDQTIRLYVSEEYQRRAQEEGWENTIDFFWMKNAFIIDYLAESLQEQGYTRGILDSFDGYTRCLDTREGATFSHTIYNCRERVIYPAAVMEYSGEKSIVSLRNYKRYEEDIRYYYEYQDGTTRTSYLDIGDGICKSALPDLTVYTSGGGCAKLLLAVADSYITKVWNPEEAEALAEDGIYMIYCDGDKVYYDEEGLTLGQFYQAEDGHGYTAQYRKRQ